MATIGQRIKLLREEAGLTQEEFGKLFGIVKSTVSMYEKGKSTPDDEIKKKVAEYFGVSLDYLMGKSEIRNPYDELIISVKEQYGPKGKKQAKELIENVQALFDGGELPDEDKDEFFKAITEIYFESKEKNKKYTPNKFRKKKEN